MKHTEVLAYTAGIVDGEGTIVIGRKGMGKDRPSCITMIVAVVNTNEWLLQWLKMQFGGNIRDHKPTNPRAKMQWIWRVESRKASEFLKLILPYLQIKRPQAELAIKFQNRKKYWGGSSQKGARHKPESEIVLEEEDRTLMHKYNKRGVDSER